MSRLVAFGCSYTYGHGLPDCFDSSRNSGPEPSKLAWPSILANLLHKELINKSVPGSSNIQILWKLLNYKFDDDDLCIIMWTHFGRHPFSKLKLDPEFHHNDNDAYSNVPFVDIDEGNLIVRNFITMHHAHLYLKSKNIKNYFLLAPVPESSYHIPEALALPTLIAGINFKNCKIDLALDNAHPGMKSQLKFAASIFNKIK